MPRGRGKIEVSLFPFLSVLCSMIGVFMLLLVAILSTRAIAIDDKVYRTNDQRRQEEERRRLAEEKRLRDDPEAIDAESYRRLEQRLAELTGQLISRRTERDQLGHRFEALQAALDAKRDELKDGRLVRGRPVELDKPEPVSPVPDPNFRVPKKPIYIEVSADGYLVQPAKKRYPLVTKQRVGEENQYTAPPELKQFLHEVNKSHETQYLLILVHPSGAEGYQALYNYLSQEFKGNINVGKEPFSQDWQFVAEQAKP